ncbi:MAG: hypothetical protein V4787_13415 [Pseudomonadota bacterium]
MIARLGSVELDVVADYLYVRDAAPRSKLHGLLCGRGWAGWDAQHARLLHNNAGFFPPTPPAMESFAQLMLRSMEDVDLLGSWVPGENLLEPSLRNARICGLADLEPYYHASPWSRALSHRRVLVVHPFASSIQSQYRNNRNLLFANPDVLPEFDLLTFESVQSSAGNPTRFRTWFDALDWMTDRIARLEFDVALIGCGAYGFPLASRIRNMGRQAIHLGGAVQILFGIKGGRWDRHPAISALFNEHWIRPGAAERPINFMAVEDGCYW